MSKYWLFQVLLLIVIQSYRTEAQEMITDRPDQTESSVSMLPGVFQLETGTVLETTPVTQVWIVNSSLFRYGIGKNLELRLVSEISRIETDAEDVSGKLRFADMQAGLKYQFINKNITAAVIAHAILPNGDEELTSGETGFSGVLCVSTPLGEKLGLGVNAGYKYLSAESELGIFSAAMSYPLNDRLGFYAEVFARWYDMEDLYWHYDNGFTFLINENLQADFSFGTGLNENYGYYSLGLSWRMK